DRDVANHAEIDDVATELRIHDRTEHVPEVVRGGSFAHLALVLHLLGPHPLSARSVTLGAVSPRIAVGSEPPAHRRPVATSRSGCREPAGTDTLMPPRT